MTAQPAYPLDSWLDDLRICIKVERMTVADTAERLGMSVRTTYRLVKQAKTMGKW